MPSPNRDEIAKRLRVALLSDESWAVDQLVDLATLVSQIHPLIYPGKLVTLQDQHAQALTLLSRISNRFAALPSIVMEARDG